MIAAGHAPTQEDRLRLTAHRLLHDLDEAARDELTGRFVMADVAAGAHVLEEGRANTRLFVVLKGAVSVKLPRDDRRVSEVKLATLGPGDHFGEYSMFDRHPVSAAVYAVEATRLAWIEKADLDAFVEAHREVGRRFYEGILRVLIARLRAKDAELDVIAAG